MKTIFTSNSRMKNYTYFNALLTLVLFCTMLESAFTQANLYGTTTDQIFTKVIPDGNNFYVFGQEGENATITRIDNNGVCQWSRILDFKSGLIDGIITPYGLLFVGLTLPIFSNINESIVGLIDIDGVINCLKKYDSPGDESITRLAQVTPTDYIAVGYHTTTMGGVVLYNIDITQTDCNIVNKRELPSTNQDSYGQDMLIPYPGSFMVCGSSGNNGVILQFDMNGQQIGAGGVLGPDQSSYVDIELTTDPNGGNFNILAAANSNSGLPPLIIRFDENLFPMWEQRIYGLNTISQIITDASGYIYVVGNASNINRRVVFKIDDINGSSLPNGYWPNLKAKYLDDQAIPYYTGFLASMPTGLVYVDGRSSSNGFGLNDNFLAITNFDFEVCDIDTTHQLDLLYSSSLFSGLAILDTTFVFDLPSVIIESYSELSCASMSVCACSADFTFRYDDDCGQVTFTNLSSGTPSLTYCWDFDGIPGCDDSSPNPTWQFPGPPCQAYIVCLTIVDSIGCTDTKCLDVIIFDQTPPVITCPPGLTIPCGSTISAGFATAVDNCTQIPLITQSDIIIPNFPCDGIIHRTWTATDLCGNSSSCLQTFVVIDNIPPLISNCPNDTTITITGVPSSCSQLVPIRVPIVTDQCDPSVILRNDYNGGLDASDNYPNGTTTVIFTATDYCGNTTTCSFTVTVVCQPPCLPACQISSLNVSTGYDEKDNSMSQPGHMDYGWKTIDAPAAVVPLIGPLPRDSYIIGKFGSSWVNSNPLTSLWISAYPFNNYTSYSCSGQAPDCSVCEPFVYERTFCLCDDDVINYNFNLLADDAAEIELWNHNTLVPSYIKTLGGNCSLPTDVNNPLTATLLTGTETLLAGKYSLRIRHWNFIGEPMGVNLNGTLAGQYLNKSECCTQPNPGFWVKKYEDKYQCNGSYDWDVTHWTTTEPGLPGWSFTIENISNPTCGGTVSPPFTATAITNAQGQAFFYNLCPGTYEIRETVQPGWINTSYPNGIHTGVNAPSVGVHVEEFGNCPCTPGQDQIINGDFSAGNIGFTSDYVYTGFNTPLGQGAYSVINWIMVMNGAPWNCLDHTTGTQTALFLAVDASTTSGKAAWRHPVNLTAGSSYTFKAYANNMYAVQNGNQSDPVVEIWIVDGNNTNTLLASKTLPEVPDQWEKIEKIWTAPTTLINPYRLEIRGGSLIINGNDFAIDDISFTECAIPQLIPCGDFESMYIRSESAAFSQQITCEDSGIILNCEPNEGFVVTGRVAIEIDSNANDVPMEWVLIGPGLYFSGTTSVLDGFFVIPLLPNYFVKTGDYNLQLTTNCSNGSNLCSINLLVNCPILCLCDSQSIDNLQYNVNKGFAQILFSNSCQACFSPVALSDCETVKWYLNTTNGAPIGTSVGNSTFCYAFNGAGTYTVIMVVNRKKPDGTDCETLTHEKTVSITCFSLPDCDDSVFRNATFSEGAVAGTLGLEGMSLGWTSYLGSPEVIEGQDGSSDEWTMQLWGNLNTASVLTSTEPMHLAIDSGVVTLRIYLASSKPWDWLKFQFLKGDNFELTNCNEIDCYKLASISLSGLNPFEWYDVQIPYDLRQWISSPGGGVVIRPSIYVTNGLISDQGAEDTYSVVHLDQLCVNGTIVATHQTDREESIRIFPNPTTGLLNIEMPYIPHSGISLQVISLTGQKLLEKTAEPGMAVQTMDASNLPQGMYFLQILSKGQVIAVNKFVKQ